ncbi:MAG TPA: FkbM family methyltransferase [Syntrophales bacterium]|nr:FkbM family methyltransferase [Syntrophales bacterium]
MSLMRRLGLCRAYLSRRRDFDCSLADLAGNLLRPTCAVLAKAHISEIAAAGGHRRVSFRGLAEPLYWPNHIPLHSLYMVTVESSDERDWHYYEAPETKVERGDVVLDCGAAEGLFSLRAMGRARCVVIEPSPVFVGSLKETFRGKGNVQIVPHALGSREGFAYLSRGTLDSALAGTAGQESPAGAVKVRTTTIDRLVAELGLARVDYIKGDLESFELEVLKGAERTIRDWMPKIAMTTYHRGNDWKEMRDYVLGLAPGYAWRVKGLSWEDSSPKPVMIHFWKPGARGPEEVR